MAHSTDPTSFPIGFAEYSPFDYAIVGVLFPGHACILMKTKGKIVKVKGQLLMGVPVATFLELIV